MALPPDVAELLREQLGGRAVRFFGVGGGCISQAGVVGFDDHPSVFVKWNPDAPPGLFDAEARGLEELRSTEAVRVPAVLALRDGSDQATTPCIVLEFLEPGTRSVTAVRQLGADLAALHRSTSERFGFFSNNFIGRLPQSNREHESWAAFFCRERLDAQLSLGERAGWCGKEVARL
ncbi:MAG: fructosamine kinase family protein, partial [Bdellovibrionales bacterium]|nr:fructosamine kinase family protein [Bdellovibrionales bacterium]